MQDVIRTSLLRHKNKRIALSDMNAILKEDGINLFVTPTWEKQFIAQSKTS